MFFLLLSVLCNAMLSIVMRLSEGRIKARVSMLSANYLTCMIISAFYVGFGNLFPSSSEGFETTLLMGMINGAFYVSGLMLIQYNIRKNGVVLSSVFSKMGALLVPLALAVTVFAEVPTAAQIVGAVLAVVSIVVINYEKGNGEKKGFDGAKTMLLVLLLSEGVASSMSKIFDEANTGFPGNFLFYTFGTAFLITLAILLARKERPGWKELLFGIGIGVPNFFASRTLLLALEEIPAVIVYPTIGVACIVVVMLAGVFLFKERLKVHQWCAIAAILAAVALLNI